MPTHRGARSTWQATPSDLSSSASMPTLWVTLWVDLRSIGTSHANMTATREASSGILSTRVWLATSRMARCRSSMVATSTHTTCRTTHSTTTDVSPPTAHHTPTPTRCNAYSRAYTLHLSTSSEVSSRSTTSCSSPTSHLMLWSGS